MEDRLELLYPYWMEKAVRAIRLHQLDAMKKAGVKITNDQLTVLLAVKEYPGAHQRELARICYKDAANVKRMLDHLTDLKLVKKSETAVDQRRQQLHLTAKGERLIAKALVPFHDAMKRGTERVPDRELQALLSTMRKIFGNLTEN
jgi:DNA-binding MarR family transcriptional regulator